LHDANQTGRPAVSRSGRTRVWWFVTAAYAALILYVGSRPNLQSPVTFPMWDKCAHLGEYGLFGLLGYMAYARAGRPLLRRMALVALAGVCVGIVDETIQAHIPGRESSIWDLAADAAGLVLAIGLTHFIATRRVPGGAGRKPR
jgi:VanZ family protein